MTESSMTTTDVPITIRAAAADAYERGRRDEREQHALAHQEATKRIRDLEDELARVRFATARIRRRKS